MNQEPGKSKRISKYATAAVFLYGVISIDEFVEVFNYYEDEKVTSDEAIVVLRKLLKTDDVEYSLSGKILSGPEFQPDFDDYEENVRFIRERQKDKPRYLPAKEEFLKYATGNYREPEEPYAILKEHILKHRLITRGEGLHGVDGDLIDLHEMIQFGVRPKDEFEYFMERGYDFKDMDDFNEFAQLVMNAHNNTRMYSNNGFTPREIFEKFEQPRLKGLKSSDSQAVPRVGRNDPCPCGSGLKYKKCCGK